MDKLLLKNAYTYREGTFHHEDILIENGIIMKIATDIHDDTSRIIDLNGALVSLGFVDMHTHLREPGYEHKGTILTESLSGLYGGYTHLVAMANTSPCMDDVETVRKFKESIQRDGQIHLYTYSAITENLKGQTLVDMPSLYQEDIVLGFSDDGKGVQSEAMMKQAMEQAQKLGALIVAHCEDERELKPHGCVHEGHYALKHHLVGINNASEYREVERNIQLVRETGASLHVCHVSTKESVALIKEAQKEGLPVSGEVSPHHLLLIDEDIQDESALYKMNPPLRSQEDRQALIAGLNEGTLSVIASDHAPHSQEEKQQSIVDAPFGIIGLQHAFPLIYTDLVKTGIVDLKTVLDALTQGPIDLLHIDHAFEIGKVANLCIFDLNETLVIQKEELQSKAKNTPFIGRKCFGKLIYMLVDGQLKVM